VTLGAETTIREISNLSSKSSNSFHQIKVRFADHLWFQMNLGFEEKRH